MWQPLPFDGSKVENNSVCMKPYEQISYAFTYHYPTHSVVGSRQEVKFWLFGING